MRFVPMLRWLPRYNRLWLVADILAGLTLWGLVVPEGMAYAGIADLPSQAGLYTLVASLLVYTLFGSSRHLSVGARKPCASTTALRARFVHRQISFWAAAGIGPNGALYGTVYGGLTAMRDTK